MLYTPQIRENVRRVRVPKDFVVDIVEYNLKPSFIALRFYQSQWARYSETERAKCVAYLKQVKQIIEGFGVPVTLEPVNDTLTTQ